MSSGVTTFPAALISTLILGTFFNIQFYFLGLIIGDLFYMSSHLLSVALLSSVFILSTLPLVLFFVLPHDRVFCLSFLPLTFVIFGLSVPLWGCNQEADSTLN